jgi:hypothetical protein
MAFLTQNTAKTRLVIKKNANFLAENLQKLVIITFILF